MLKFLFGGRLSRIHYALFAVPILLFQAATPVLLMHAPRFLEKTVGADLTTVGAYMTPMMILVILLTLVLTVVSIKRLRDAGWTPWLALPVFLRFPVGFAVGWYVTKVMGDAIVEGTEVDPVISAVAIWLPRIFFIYVHALVLVLLVVPGRKPTAKVSPAAVF